MRKRKSNAFTLLEMLGVIALAAITLTLLGKGAYTFYQKVQIQKELTSLEDIVFFAQSYSITEQCSSKLLFERDHESLTYKLKLWDAPSGKIPTCLKKGKLTHLNQILINDSYVNYAEITYTPWGSTDSQELFLIGKNHKILVCSKNESKATYPQEILSSY